MHQKITSCAAAPPKNHLHTIWTPFGAGRQFGGNGYGKDREWRHLGENKASSSLVSGNVPTTSARPGTTTKSAWGYKPARGTPAPTSAR